MAALSMLGVFSSYMGMHLLNRFFSPYFLFSIFPHIFPCFPVFPFPYSFSSHTVSPLFYKERTNYSNKNAWQWKQINLPTVRQKFVHLFSLKETLEFPFWSQSNSLNTWKKLGLSIQTANAHIKPLSQNILRVPREKNKRVVHCEMLLPWSAPQEEPTESLHAVQWGRMCFSATGSPARTHQSLFKSSSPELFLTKGSKNKK